MYLEEYLVDNIFYFYTGWAMFFGVEQDINVSVTFWPIVLWFCRQMLSLKIDK